MKHSRSRDVYAVWDAARGMRRAPTWERMNPAAFGESLAEMFVLEASAGTFRIRASGRALDLAFAASQDGCAFGAWFGSSDRARVDRLLADVCQEVCPYVAGMAAAPAAGPPVAFELLLLPLMRQGATGERVLGSLAAHRLPVWAGLRTLAPLRLDGFRSLDPRLIEDAPRFRVHPRPNATGSIPRLVQQAAPSPIAY